MKKEIECLINWLDSVPSDEKAHQILRILAVGSINQDWNEENIKRFTNKDIFEAADPETLDPPNKWVNWKNTVLPYWDIKKQRVIEFARNQGLDSYPDIECYISDGGRSNPSSYWLIKKPLPEIDDEVPLFQPEKHSKNEQSHIHYKLEEKGDVKPAWGAKWLLHDGQIRLSIRHIWGILGCLLLIGGGTVVVSFISWLGLTIPKSVTTRELTVLISTLGLPYLVWVVFIRPWWSLFDERIVVAPELLVSMEEKSAQIELFRDGDLRMIRLVRYSAPCPICGSTIHLDKGEPDYPRRLVGRCYESPREHIFSFDRVTQKGIILRGAELITPSE